MNPGFVYAIGCHAYTKIGYCFAIDATRRHIVLNRLAQLQCGSPYELTLDAYAWVEDPPSFEAWLHRRLRQHRLRGEWFALDRAPAIFLLYRLGLEAQRTEALPKLSPEERLNDLERDLESRLASFETVELPLEKRTLWKRPASISGGKGPILGRMARVLTDTARSRNANPRTCKPA